MKAMTAPDEAVPKRAQPAPGIAVAVSFDEQGRPAVRIDYRPAAPGLSPPALAAAAPAQAPRPAISVAGLLVQRGGRVVIPGLSLEVAPGAVTGLLGPSGCGKTTLMRAIMGVQRVEAGTVEVLGQPAGVSGLRSRVGYMTQAPSIYPDLSARENLAYFARILGAPSQSISTALDTVRLTDHADQMVGRLSGGQRARASLAAALLGQPDLVVLDEPTVGLDPLLREELWEAFHRLAENGVTLLVSSHVMDEAAHCDHLLLMREGELVATGSPADLRAQTGLEDLSEAFVRLIDQREATQ